MDKIKTLGIIIICVACVLSVVITLGLQKYNNIINPHKAFEKDLKQQQDLKKEKDIHGQLDLQGKEIQEKEDVDNSILDNLDSSKNVINILLLGIDSSEKRESKRMGYRSDTIIVSSVNLDTKEVKMLSIPRDTYTDVPGNKNKDKINHAMAFGGGPKKKGNQYAVQAVEGLLGIDIHYYITVDMDAVKTIVDTIGGVTVDVERNMASREKVLEKGEQKLNGEQALIYLRNRNTPTGDFARIKQQQKFMLTLFQQAKKNRKMTEIIPLYLIVQDKIFTDLKVDQIGALAYLLKDIESNNIEAFSLKGKGIRINGIYYLEIDRNHMEKIINENFHSI